MNTRLCAATMAAVLPVIAPLQAAEAPSGWQTIRVPGVWDGQLDGAFDDYDGVAWYRTLVRPPADWVSGALIELEAVDNSGEVFLNGTRLGGGRLGDFLELKIPEGLLVGGAENAVAIRVVDEGGRGGFKGRAPVLRKADDAIVMAGEWEFRTGDDPAWSKQAAGNGNVFVTVTRTTQSAHETQTGWLSPAESAAKIKTPDDLEVDLLLHEPLVQQPLHLSFDERGRLWIVQYIQYPEPAGIKQLSRDKVWRIVYDRMPPPPPHAPDSPFRGKDRISIHEDSDGDGVFDVHKVFADGLNMATSVAIGRGGVWVTNPPYLLFYPDENRDDVPDGPPVVHLKGFGLEDTHSIANSLRWGPDGWLYATQGSTISAAILRPGIDKSDADAIKTMGQNVWRYHPERRIYEVFAEGGGNAYGTEIDAKGRIFSGHNGGDTRGFHYVQGGYFRKGFNKHGELTDPYSFGYFPHIKSHSVARFTHHFIINEGGGLPGQYEGKLFGVDVLHNNIVLSEVTPLGSTFQTKDLGRPMASDDPWFRPVHIIDGPDGALYVADWYDKQVNHYRNHEGRIDHEMGRVYRLRGKNWKPSTTPDLFTASRDELFGFLHHPNRWYRQTALRVLADHADRRNIDRLRATIVDGKSQRSLESLWALHQIAARVRSKATWPDLPPRVPAPVPKEEFTRHLDHPDPHVRAWTIRLLGDEGVPTIPIGEKLLSLAKYEVHPEVRSQLACTAKRLPAPLGLAIAKILATRDADAVDPHIPLLIWWAIEAKCATAPEQAVALFQNKSWWQSRIVRETLAERIIKRFAMAGSRADLLACAQLLASAPGPPERAILLKGFEDAFQGRTMTNLPDALLAELASGSLVLRLRKGDEAAVREAIALIQNSGAPESDRLQAIQYFGETANDSALGDLLEIAGDEKASGSILKACLAALQRYAGAEIAVKVIVEYPRYQQGARSAARELLTSRADWSSALLDAIEAKSIPATDFTLPLIKKIQLHGGGQLEARVHRHWGKILAATAGEKEKEIARVKQVLDAGRGVPKVGEATFTARCAGCHSLFNKGGKLGPDLTSYQRDDLDTMLLSIIAPSAEIREGFENTVVTTRDGAVYAGFLADEDKNVIVLRDLAGQNHAIPRDALESRQSIGVSLMPESLLAGLDEQQLRDLFAYLRSTTPPF